MPAPSKRITTRSMTLGRPQTPKAHSKRRAPDATNQDRGKAAKKKRTHSDDLPEESPPELKPEHAKWIHPANVNSYQIYANNPLSIIFDPVSPCRIFVPGETYSDNERMPFADPSDNMTYVDSGDSNPIKPSTFKVLYRFTCTMATKHYYHWERDELRQITVIPPTSATQGKKGEDHSRIFNIPAPYDSVIGQLLAEIQLSVENNFHEGRRRETYAIEVLNAFGAEIWQYSGPPQAFRSKVLTPILARIFRGVSDAYLPFLNTAISGVDGVAPSMEQVVRFYLGHDLADPAHINTYRRNLLFLPISRWYLGCLMTRYAAEDAVDYYMRCQDNHDNILEFLESLKEPPCRPGELPLLSKVEAHAVAKEQISNWFLPEIMIAVWRFSDLFLFRIFTHCRARQPIENLTGKQLKWRRSKEKQERSATQPTPPNDDHVPIAGPSGHMTPATTVPEITGTETSDAPHTEDIPAGSNNANPEDPSKAPSLNASSPPVSPTPNNEPSS